MRCEICVHSPEGSMVGDAVGFAVELVVGDAIGEPIDVFMLRDVCLGQVTVTRKD